MSLIEVYPELLLERLIDIYSGASGLFGWADISVMFKQKEVDMSERVIAPMSVEAKAALLDSLLGPIGLLTELVRSIKRLSVGADETGCTDDMTVVEREAVDTLTDLIEPLQSRFGDAGGKVADRCYRGELERDGETLFVGEFRAPVDALTPELDQAFMAVIAQGATIRYTKG